MGAVSRQMRVAPHQISFGTEMSLFAGHAAGLLILLEIINRSQSAEGPRLRVRFSRKASSRIYGVSRAHITAILAKAEQSHMLVRDGNEILLDEKMLSNVQHDLACQLAFVVLADAGKPVAEPI